MQHLTDEQVSKIRSDERLVAAIRENNARDPRFRINYWITHPDDKFEDASFFQAFLPGIIANADFIISLASFPADIRELVSDREHILFSRIAGFTDLVLSPIQISAFAEIAQHVRLPFNCVVSTDETQAEVSLALQHSQGKWLHLSTKPSDVTLDIRDFSAAHLFKYIQESANSLPEGDAFRDVVLGYLNQSQRATISPIDCPSFRHNLTLPNEVGFRALRYAPNAISSLVPAHYTRYVDSILQTATVAFSERERLLNTVNHDIYPTTTLVIATESMTWSAFHGENNFLESKIPRHLNAAAKALLRRVVRQEKYFLEMPSEKNDLSSFVDALCISRHFEMKAFTAGLSILCGPTMTPVVRLEPKLNRIRGLLIDVEGCARGGSPHHQFKLNKLGHRVRDELHSSVDARLISYLSSFDKRIEGITLVSDAPLEWLPIKNVPLILRHDVSRIPATPGNIMMMQCLRQRRLDIGRSKFEEILVVRSFNNNDRLKKLFESAVNNSMWAPPIGHRFRFVDVQTPTEFVSAVNSFSGALMIFDGHGTRDSESGAGSIIVGGKPLDIWSLRKEISMPPIVLLSACDTLPLDGSHGSTAVGMLLLGAVTVLATVSPIDGFEAALLLARLAYKLEAFVPIALRSNPRGLNWRRLVGGMLRSNYMTDVLFALYNQHKLISRSDVEAIGSDINLEINTYQANWHEKFVDRICMAAGGRRERALAAFKAVSGLPDALKYLQIGRPELLNIVDETAADIIEQNSCLLNQPPAVRPFGDFTASLSK